MATSYIKAISKKGIKFSYLFAILPLLASYLTFLSGMNVYAAGENLSNPANKNGIIGTPVEINDLQITGTGNDNVSIAVSVASGMLSFASAVAVVTNNGTSNVVVSGPRNDVNSTLSSLSYTADNLGSATITADYGSNVTDVIIDPIGGHAYKIINSDVTGDIAALAAAQLSYGGVQGYLANITSEDEDEFIVSNLTGNGWIGASDRIAEGDWIWSEGPEAGTPFWTGLEVSNGGIPVDGEYSNWNAPEPNDSNNEDCAEYIVGEGWNDLPCNSVERGYVVEFGATSEVPEQILRQFTITTTGPEAVVGSCEELQAVDDEAGSQFASISLTNNIDCEGQTIDPLFIDNSFRGQFDGNSHTISNFVIDQPDERNVGLISQTSGQVVIKDLNIENVSVTGNEEVGALVGSGDGGYNITNVHARNVEVVSTEYGLVGGLIGNIDVEDGFDSLIRNVSVEGTVSATGLNSSDVGGLIGMVEAQSSDIIIEQAYTDVDVTNVGTSETEGDTFVDVGGLIGEVEADNSYEGGDSASVVVRDTYAWGNIKAENSENVGGLIGRFDVEHEETSESDISALATVQRSYARGSVTGLSDVGGLIGQIDRVSDAEDMNYYVLENNFAMGHVTELDENILTGHGGLVGSFEEFAPDSVGSSGNYIDEGRTAQDVCNSIISMEGCMVTNIAAEPRPNYFINNTTNAPLNTWDFENVWVANTAVPPTFKTYVLGEDLNGDQVADSEQPNIRGYVSSISGKTVAIDVGEDCELTTDNTVLESSLAVQDPNYTYESGLWDFEAECETPGATSTIKLYYYDTKVSGLSLRKYNPNTQTYFKIEGASVTQEEIDGSNVLVATYQITDGGELDMDREINGVIKDPAGIGALVALQSGNTTGLSNTGDSTVLYAALAGLPIIVGGITFALRRRFSL